MTGLPHPEEVPYAFRWGEADRLAPFDATEYVTREGDRLEVGQDVTVRVRVDDFGPDGTVVKLHPRSLGDVPCVCVIDACGRRVCVNAVNVTLLNRPRRRRSR